MTTIVKLILNTTGYITNDNLYIMRFLLKNIGSFYIFHFSTLVNMFKVSIFFS